MTTRRKKFRSFSFYVKDKTFPFLLDLLAEKSGFRSRSELLNFVIEMMLEHSGLYDAKKKYPTKLALRKSRQLRNFLDDKRQHPSKLNVEALMNRVNKHGLKEAV